MRSPCNIFAPRQKNLKLPDLVGNGDVVGDFLLTSRDFRGVATAESVAPREALADTSIAQGSRHCCRRSS